MDDSNSSTSAPGVTQATASSARASPSFVHQPEANGIAERAIRTLKEQLLWIRRFTTVEELRQALAAFAERYNASWLRQRHGHNTPNQIRAEPKAIKAQAAMEVKMVA
jgi:putative transposase